MASLELHRTKDRRHLPVPIRVERLEEDQDVSDHRHDEIEKLLHTLNSRVLGVVGSLVVAVIMLALNLAFK